MYGARTEATWETAASLREYLWYVCGDERDESGRPFPSPTLDRKARLIGLAALRAIWPHIPDPRCREAIELIEQYVDDLGLLKLRRAEQLARDSWDDGHVPDADGFVERSWEGQIAEVV